jgi:hypothetical protein
MRSKEELAKRLAENSAWRKKEISTIRQHTHTTTGDVQILFIRAGIVILYAHWEGFTKAAAKAYLNYVRESVKRKTASFGKLKPCFQALSLWRVTMHGHEQNRSTIDFVRDAKEILDQWENAVLPDVSALVDTEGNLTSKTFRRIFEMLDIDYTMFQGKEKFIDEKINKSRHRIAHGEHQLLDLLEFDSIHDEIVGMIEGISNTIIDASSQRRFLR